MESPSHQRKPGTDIVCFFKHHFEENGRVEAKKLLVSRCVDFSVVISRIQGITTHLMMQFGRISREIEGLKQWLCK